MVPLSFLVALLFPVMVWAIHEESLDHLPGLQRLWLTSASGPESLAFDRWGGGPYTGISDGRVMKWQGQALGWTVFATPSGRRANECDGSVNILMESMCGRPLGLQFNKATGDLYIADASYGLLRVGPKGGTAVQLATVADGEKFHWCNGMDVDQETGVVYFTVSSRRFERSDYLWAVIAGDATGRLISYDPKTKKLRVLMKGLAVPNGVAISEDKSFLLIAETAKCRILRYWLRGARTGTSVEFAKLPGYPDNIKKNPGGEFWVAINREKVKLYNNPPRNSELANKEGPTEHIVALRLDKKGEVLEVFNGNILTFISEVEEQNGTLWFGSVDMPYVGVYKF